MKNYISLMVSLFFCFCVTAKEPVLIMSHHCNRPEFIELQDTGFKRYLKDNYTFIVFNDARQPSIRQAIDSTCARLNIECISIPQEVHDRPYLYRESGEDYNHACIRCANVVQYSLDERGFDHNGIVVIIDSDMFLIKDLNITEFMQDTLLAGIPQSRGDIQYIWNGLVLLDCSKLPDKKTLNFNCGRIRGIGLDVGGYTSQYIEQHPEVKVRWISNMYVSDCSDFKKNNLSFEEDSLARKRVFMSLRNRCGLTNYEFPLDNAIFHYRGGTNWDYKSQEYHLNKTKEMNRFFDDLWEATLLERNQ